PAVAAASRRGHPEDELGSPPRDPGRAVSVPQDGRGCGGPHRGDGRGRLPVPGGAARNRHGLHRPDGRRREGHRRRLVGEEVGGGMEIFTLWLWPLLALILLPGLLVYFGLHVFERGIIFVDLALAQIAALGICVAIALGSHPGHDALPYVLSVVFTLMGAALFAWTRFNHPRVPQESIIGIIYVVAAAAATLVLSHSAEGDEALKNLLVGNVLLVTKNEVLRTFGLFAVIGITHVLLRKRFLMVTFHEDEARGRGMALRLW